MHHARSVEGGGCAAWEEDDQPAAKAFLLLQNDKVPPTWPCSGKARSMQVAKVVGGSRARMMMIANVLAFSSSPKRSPATVRKTHTMELVTMYHAHFALGEYDERRLAMPCLQPGGRGIKVKSGKRPAPAPG